MQFGGFGFITVIYGSWHPRSSDACHSCSSNWISVGALTGTESLRPVNTIDNIKAKIQDKMLLRILQLVWLVLQEFVEDAGKVQVSRCSRTVMWCLRQLNTAIPRPLALRLAWNHGRIPPLPDYFYILWSSYGVTARDIFALGQTCRLAYFRVGWDLDCLWDQPAENTSLMEGEIQVYLPWILNCRRECPGFPSWGPYAVSIHRLFKGIWGQECWAWSKLTK